MHVLSFPQCQRCETLRLGFVAQSSQEQLPQTDVGRQFTWLGQKEFSKDIHKARLLALSGFPFQSRKSCQAPLCARAVLLIVVYLLSIRGNRRQKTVLILSKETHT